MNMKRNPKDRDRNKPSAFEMDDRITVKLNPGLAVELGDLILQSDTDNSAILALGHKLQNCLEEDNSEWPASTKDSELVGVED